jgi:CubicO group peptidase (beta-lactamase class C family)
MRFRTRFTGGFYPRESESRFLPSVWQFISVQFDEMRAILLAAVLAMQPSPIAHVSPADRARAFLKSVLKSSGTPALQAAVAVRGKIVFSEGIGTADRERGIPADAKTVFNVGSISKLETAVAVMQLVESGKVGLDDDIRTYVPSFPDKGATITIRELLTHSSGIRNYVDTDFPDTPDHDNLKPFASFEQAIGLFKDDPLLFPPGKYFFYSSFAVNLVQGVIEKASGLPFERYMRERVWRPAGMTRSSFDVPGRKIENRARSYRIEKTPPERIPTYDLTYKFASGGMLGSSEDLARMGAALNAGTLLKPETVRKMFTPVSSPTLWYRGNRPPGREKYRQAIMFRILDSKGRRLAYGCGSVNGFNMCLVDDLDADIVAVEATNSWGRAGGWKQPFEIGQLFRRFRPSTIR